MQPRPAPPTISQPFMARRTFAPSILRAFSARSLTSPSKMVPSSSKRRVLEPPAHERNHLPSARKSRRRSFVWRLLPFATPCSPNYALATATSPTPRWNTSARCTMIRKAIQCQVRFKLSAIIERIPSVHEPTGVSRQRVFSLCQWP